MNIAITTVILAIFLLPGILYRRFYYTEQFSKQYVKKNFFELFFSTLIPTIFLQSLWIFVVRIFNYRIDFSVISNLLFNRKLDLVSQNINENYLKIIFYHITLFIFSIIIGVIFKQIIRKYKFDRSFKILRYKNYWHYLFFGEIFDFPRTTVFLDETTDDIDFTYVSVISDTNAGVILYDGLLVDYELNKDGELEHIIISETKRKYLSKKEVKGDYDMPGNIFIIPMKSVININLSFYRFDIIEIEGDKVKITLKLIE